jgi:hypothetical protein
MKDKLIVKPINFSTEKHISLVIALMIFNQRETVSKWKVNFIEIHRNPQYLLE